MNITIEEQAKALSETFNKSERVGVSFGMFPHAKMPPEGPDSRALCVALMDLVEMRA